MSRTSWFVVAAVLVAAGGAASAFADDAAPPATPATTNVVKQQTMCPVMGGAVNKKIFADYQGKRVYFCCNDCPALFKKDPAKFITKLEAEGITLDKTPGAATPTAPAATPQARNKGKADAHADHPR